MAPKWQIASQMYSSLHSTGFDSNPDCSFLTRWTQASWLTALSLSYLISKMEEIFILKESKGSARNLVITLYDSYDDDDNDDDDDDDDISSSTSMYKLYNTTGTNRKQLFHTNF